MQETQVAHVENAVQNNQQQLDAKLQHIQDTMKTMQLHYSAEPQPTYQEYGGLGNYGGNKGFRGRVGRG